MGFKKWLFSDVDKSLVSSVAEDCSLDPLVVLIAFSRGLVEPYEIEQFFEKEPEFCDPFDYSGVSEAVERINIAIESEENILIFGDYDCDGVTATALLVKYLKSRGANVDYFVPDRENDGYGISINAVEKAASDGVTLIITVDNGINAVMEVARANELGIDIVVTDHHLPKEQLPDAVAVIDPHIDVCCDWLFCDFCGVGVAFMLVSALEGRNPQELLYEYGDLVTLGTIADVVPLVSDNRIIVNTGIEVIRRRQNLGIKALIEVSGSRFINAGNVAFTLCPRINAAGRMASADVAVKLLLSNNTEDATYYASILDRLNTERQDIEQRIFDNACEIIERNGYDKNRVIVVDGSNWHVGVIGIAASKLVDRYGKPAIIINTNGDKSIGSGRSISGFSLFNALCFTSDVLVKFGGHELAAGFTIKEDEIITFRKMINEYALSCEMPFSTIKIDCKIKPRALTVDVAKALKVFEPYGAGNPVPLFAIMGCRIIAIQSLSGGKHIRLKLRKDNVDFYAVMFSMSPDNFEFRIGDIIDLAVTIDVNTYNDTESVSVIVRSVRKSGIDDDYIIKQIVALDKFDFGVINSDEAQLICPDRQDVINVFRYIQKNSDVRYCNIEYDLIDMMGYGKLNVAIQALLQLGIISNTDGHYNLTSFNGKTELDKAEILIKLKEHIKAGELN